MVKSTLIISLLFALLGCTTAPVQTGVPNYIKPSAAAATIGWLDANGDGRISQSEYSKAGMEQGLSSRVIATDFAKLDLNGDGMLDAHEVGSGLSLQYNE